MSLARCPDSARAGVKDLGSPDVTSGELDGGCADSNSRCEEGENNGSELHGR